MSLSYLVEEHQDDFVVEDVVGQEQQLTKEEMMIDDSQPFDVQAASSNDGSSVEIAKNITKKRQQMKRQQQQLEQQQDTPDPLNRRDRRGTPVNEVGDLPTLSIDKSDQQLGTAYHNGVTGGRATRVRPLSPPSRAGLDDPDRYSHKTGKSSGGNSTGSEDMYSEDDTDDHYTNTEYGSNSRVSTHFASTDDMPMDERRDYAKQKAEQRLQALAVCTGGDDPASNFCDSTLTAMNDLCSGGASKAGTSGGKRSLVLGEKHSLRYAAGVEEQTAIEVEYVEPMYRGRNGDDNMYSPKRKNALLRAMARRAKEDFDHSKKNGKKQEARDTSPSAEVGDNGSETGLSTPVNENVYASFSASEKRKFLKLINGGMSPFDATAQVMKERIQAEESKKFIADESKADGAGKMASAAALAAVKSRASTKNTVSESSPPKKRGLAFWKRGNKDKTNKEKDAMTLASKSPGSSRALASTPASAVPRYGAGSPSDRMATQYQESDDEEDADIVQGFARSGINYYDAVRRDRSNDEADDYEDDDENQKQNRSKSKSSKFPKIGFSKLGKDGSNDDFSNRNAKSSLPRVQPHVAIPSPTKPREEIKSLENVEKQIQSMVASPSTPQQNIDTVNMVRPIPVKADISSRVLATSEQVIPSAVSGESLLTEESRGQFDEMNLDGEEKKAEEHVRVNEEDAIEDAMTAKLLGVSALKSLGESTEQPNTRPKKHVELDMDTYLNSTETMSHFGGASGSFDHASVVSGRSYRTSHTTGTNHTQSTRTRRPGQAKIRMEKEKSKRQNKPSGWQESIQAAAAMTGRSWDPDHGWRDYVDPKTVGTEEDLGVKSAELIHVSLDQLRKGREDGRSVVSSEDCSSTGSPVKVPFPPNWQEERSSMAGLENAAMERLNSSSQHSLAQSRRSKAAKVISPPRDDKPRGWVETMKAATANINSEGKRWDAEKGWVGGDGRELLDETASAAEQAYLDEVAITADSDTQDFGTLEAARTVPVTPDTDNQEPTMEQLQAIADQNQDSGLQFLSEDEEHTGDEEVGSTSRSIEARSNGRYVQIKDTGSVQSHYPNSYARSQQLQHPAHIKSPNVISENEVAEVSRSFEEPSNSPKQGEDAERSSGPIDLDDVYDEEISAFYEEKELEENGGQSREMYEQASNDEFEMEQDFSWDEDDANEPASTKRAVPTLRINIRDHASSKTEQPTTKASGSQSEASFGSMSTSSRSIPRLAGPKRDSSPIHAGRKSVARPSRSRLARSGSEATASTLPAGTARSIQSSSEDSNDFANESDRLAVESSQQRKIGQKRSPVHLDPKILAPKSYAVKNLESRFDSAKEPPVQKVENAPVDRSKAGEFRGRKSHTDSSPSSVKDLHDYWESRSSTPPDATAQSAEWKSFLAKKVQAEASAAASKKDRNGAATDDEKDTLFDFNDSEGAFPAISRKAYRGGTRKPGEPPNGAFDDISDLSPIRHDESDSDFAASEASTNIAQGTTFLQRLQACAAPMVNKTTQNCGPSVPMAAHLAFLRSNPNVGGNPDKHIPNPSPGLCGRPDVIVEEDEEEGENNETMETSMERSSMTNTASYPSDKRQEQSRSRSNPRPRQKDDVSSVISDEFGAKTAYLEAIAMKAAVSGGSKKKRRSPGSDVSGSTASKHSDKFQQFLDRRASKGDSQHSPESANQQLPDAKPPKAQSDVSSRAEKYATEKVEEMMQSMAGRTKPSGLRDYRGRPMEEETGAFPTLPLNRQQKDTNGGMGGTHTDSIRLAAEELAAARMEAMMQNLSSQNMTVEEGEI